MNEVSADGVGIDGGNGNVRKAKFLPFEAFYKIGWPMTFLAREITCTTRIKDPIVMRKGLISDVFLANTNSPRWGNILQMNQTNVLLFQVKDLPNELTSVDSLMAFLTRLLWQLSAQHAALNYPVADYGGFTLNMPTKLYQDSRVSDDVFSLFNFPNANISAVSILSSLYRHIVLISPRDYKRLINSLYYGLQCNFCACLMSQLDFRV